MCKITSEFYGDFNLGFIISHNFVKLAIFTLQIIQVTLFALFVC